MKIDPFVDQESPENHPLTEAVEALRRAHPGHKLRISDLPRGYYGRDPDALADELSVLCDFGVGAEVGDDLRTPESYIVTRLS